MSRLHSTLDMAIDFATLGEFGVAPSERARRFGSPITAEEARQLRSRERRPARVHRVQAVGRTAAPAPGMPDPRVVPATAGAGRFAALRRERGATSEHRTAPVHGRRASLVATAAPARVSQRADRPAEVVELDSRRRPAARAGEQLSLDVAA